MQNEHIYSDKENTRNIIRKRWREYSPAQLEAMSSRIMNSIENSRHFQNATNIIMFYSLKDEPDTHSFLKRWSRKKNIYLPIVEGENMIVGRYADEKRLYKGAFGIMEPKEKDADIIQAGKDDVFLQNHSSSIIIVPGVAFTLDGARLGRGKGYYDRFFTQKGFKNIYKIGICFPYQILNSLPFEEHDIFMDEIIFQ